MQVIVSRQQFDGLETRRMAPSKDKWVRRFLITETSRHKKGYTVYKITSVIYPKSAPEAVSRVSIWKRYNDFRKLHRELSSRHESLKIKEPFPPLPKPKFFGRFEAEVIEERRQCAIKLLEFIAKHTLLFTSNVFVKFFESGSSLDYLTDCSLSVSSDTSEDDQNLNSALSGTNYLPTPVCNSQTSTSSNRTKTDFCLDNNEAELKNDNSSSISYSTNLTAGSLPKNLSLNNNYIEELNPNDERIVDVRKSKSIDDDDDNVGETCERRPSASGQNSSSKSKALEFTSNNTLIHDGSDLPSAANEDPSNYILVAAAHMSAAFRHEAICEYEEAFTQYKLGISNLLNGVQSDLDLGRRAIIKEKISKYLERAEKLYNRHLNCNVSVLSKPASELQSYKVLRVIGSVMLVRDISRDCNRVIKTVQKSAGSAENLSDYILRGRIPFMVRLYACIQTETTVFLILQYASGGKLWEYMKSYYKGRNSTSNWSGKGHARSASCDAILQSSFEKEIIVTVEKKSLRAKEICCDVQSDTRDVDADSDLVEEAPIDPDESFKKLEEEFGVNSASSKNFPTNDLLAKAQALLRSVDATLKKSNSIASRLNDSENLLYNKNKSEPEETVSNVNHSVDSNSHEGVKIVDETLKDKKAGKLDENKIFHQVSLASDVDNNPAYGKQSSQITKTTLSSSKVSEDCPDNSSTVNELCKASEDISYLDQFQTPLNEDSGIEMDDELWKLPEGTIRFWAAEILLSLESLHQQDIIVADLKPDNILLGNGGHVALSYIVPRRSFEFLQLKKPYSAPELCMFVPIVPPSTAADVWSYGVLLYELFTGIKFQAKHPGPFHSHSILNIPEEISSNVKSLMSNILRYQPEERLTIPEIKDHPFFSDIDWESLANSSFT